MKKLSAAAIKKNNLITFSEYVKHLNQILESDPRAKDLICVSSSDEEGNSYTPIYYNGTLAKFENLLDSNLELIDTTTEFDDKVNAIIIN
jgi:hypothetical protein